MIKRSPRSDARHNCSVATRRAAPRRSPGGCWPSRRKTRVARGLRSGRGQRDCPPRTSTPPSPAASLIVTWLNRGTLHLVRAEDYWWLHPLTTPQLRTGNSRRWPQEDVAPEDAERAVAIVRAALAADGPLTRAQLRGRVAAAGVRTEGQAMVHILALASIRGLIVRGPPAGRDQAFVLARDWLGAPPPAMGREAALGELARRYLAGHAPAADRDLARWAGIGLADARLGLARCGAVQRADGLAELPVNPQRAAAALPPPLLLGAFDPLLLGWASRDFIVGPYRRIVTVNGLVPAVRAGRRAGRGDLEHHARPGRARTVQPAGRRDPGSPGHRRRRRDTVPGRIAGPAGCYIRRGPTCPRACSSAHRHIPPISCG